MRPLSSLFAIARPVNVAMAAAATALGFWLGHAAVDGPRVLLLLAAAACATAFGNVINDILDIDTDRISHPQRPLPSGRLSTRAAGMYAVLLAVAALGASTAVSWTHAAATAVPLALLAVYATLLKGVPLLGNVLVAALVAYPVVFGAIGTPLQHRLWVPAGLAFLLNLSREITKDLQDEAGDRAVGLRTSAVLPRSVLNVMVVAASAVYGGMLFVPWASGNFGRTYAVICLAAVVPLHIARLCVFLGGRAAVRTRRASALLKVEMLAGLAALAVDELTAFF